jgi:hypothetical protein
MVQPESLSTTNEYWDGSSWTEVADSSTSVGNEAGTGSSTSALMAGGNSSKTATEEFTAPASFDPIREGEIFYNTTANAIKANKLTFGTGAWATGGTLNTARGNAHASGTQTAGLFSGGDPVHAVTELYDGSTWTEVNDMNTGRGQTHFSNSSPQTDHITASGYDTAVTSAVESWNGTNWTEVAEVNTASRNGASFGESSTAMVKTGGAGSPTPLSTELWNGTSWTEIAEANTSRFVSRGGAGTSTAGIIAGNYPSPGNVADTELWNGTSWTEVNNLNTGRSGIGFSGTQTTALAHGGGVGTPQAAQVVTESWDGTSWTELADLSQASQSGCGAGSSTSGLHMGGYGPSDLSATEEWTVPSSITVKSITVS